MPFSRRAQPKFRWLAALIAACYCFVGLTLSFQHTDCAAREMETALGLPTFTATGVRMPLKTRVSSARKTLHKPHVCAACEWQANNLSPALPVFTFHCAPLTRLCVLTTLPRYLQTRLVLTSSRAPPLA